MHYEINVARRFGSGYTHLFATAERSLTSLDDLKLAYDRIVAAFPAPEFNITVTQRENVGVGLSADTLALMFGRRPKSVQDVVAQRRRRTPNDGSSSRRAEDGYVGA